MTAQQKKQSQSVKDMAATVTKLHHRAPDEAIDDDTRFLFAKAVNFGPAIPRLPRCEAEADSRAAHRMHIHPMPRGLQKETHGNCSSEPE